MPESILKKPVFWLSIAVLLALELTSKFWARSLSEPIALGPLVSIEAGTNSAAALGLASGVPPAMLALLSLALIIPLFYIYHRSSSRLLLVGMILMIAGLVGNGVERILFSEVTDWIVLNNKLMLNLADIFATTGLLLSILYLCLIYFRQEEPV